MNDKMELEESINILRNKIYSLNENIKIYDKGYDLSNKDKFVKEREAIETVLQALENSIPKKKIEDLIKKWHFTGGDLILEIKQLLEEK